jgi:hypothetical protein
MHAALAYYHDHRERIDADIRDGEAFADRLRGGARPSSRRRGNDMPQTIRFQLDEHCATALAVGLRRYGIDVTTTPEAGLLGASDQEQVTYALAEGRVLFTQDDAFLRLHAAGVPHAGIAYCHPGPGRWGKSSVASC